MMTDEEKALGIVIDVTTEIIEKMQIKLDHELD